MHASRPDRAIASIRAINGTSTVALAHTYDNRTKASEEARKAAAHGWRIDAEDPYTPPVQDRLLESGGGSFTALVGISQPGEVTVTFVRTDEWLAAHRK
jgi:hypothetical protein